MSQLQQPTDASSAQPRTAELPVVKRQDGATVAGPAAPYAASDPPPTVQEPAPSPVRAAAMQYPPPPPVPEDPVGHPSGPGGVVPGLPGVGVSSSAPTSGRRISYGPRARAGLAGLALATVSLVLTVLGVWTDLGGVSLWSRVPLWSLLATAGSALGLLGFIPDAPGRSRLRPHSGWLVAVAGWAALAAFWLLVVLPDVADTDTGLLLTAALAALGAALWMAPSREG